jgi:hypothetical protein
LQTTTTEATIRDLETKRYQAVLDHDYNTFEGLCHDHLTYGHSGGNRDSLANYMTKLRSGLLRYRRIDHHIEDIVQVGDTALVVGRMTADAIVLGASKALDNSFLAVWIKDAGEWKFLAYQPTPRAVAI